MSKKKILIVINNDAAIYNFRLELIERFISEGFEVFISAPKGDRTEEIKSWGCKFYDTKLERHGMNPIEEYKLYKFYDKLIKGIKPDVVLGYTIKPNIYGCMAATKNNVPFIANITGLGTAVENPGLTQKILIALYKFSFRKVKKVFFQNDENKQFFVERKIALGKHGMLPGSGVSLNRFHLKEYPTDDIIRFAFLSRVMKEKGIDQYLDAAKAIKEKYPNTEFHICGFCEPEYDGTLNDYVEKGIVVFHGMIKNVPEFLENINCVIHPTYYPEGLSNVLLESCATGRPIITTDRSGCREVVEEGVNGFVVPQQDSEKLIETVDKFMQLSIEEKKNMGLAGRRKVEKEFDRNIVVEAYMKEINSL